MASVWQGIPVDIERRGMRRPLAPFQHVEPPCIVGMADAHVVRHEIEDQPEAVRLERGAHPRKAFGTAEFGIELLVVDDVVAMRAARPRFQEWRRIEVGDAEFFEIGNERGGIVKSEILRQLQTIGRERDFRGHHARPIAA